MATRQIRTCPLCKKNYKSLGVHLKLKHNLSDRKERAPYLKQALQDSRTSSVKNKQTIPKMVNKETTIQTQERELRDNFLYLEDTIVDLQLQARYSPQIISANVQSVQEEVRRLLIPLYTMVRTSMETIMYEPPLQVKQSDSVVPESKRNCEKTTDPSFFGCGLDFLKNGLVQCQKCLFTCDENAKHDCRYEEEVKKE